MQFDRKAKIETIKDGFENLIAGLNGGTDKRAASRYVNTKQLSRDGNREELNALYRTSWVIGKVVDIIPNDMTREWRSFIGDIEPEIVNQLIELEERLKLSKMFNMAHKWARLYGTAFILLSVDDGQDPKMPLDINKIKPGGLKHIKVLDRHRLTHRGTIITDPFEPNFGFPEYYTPVETSIEVHHSRLLRFDGTELPFDEFRRNNYWSDSVVDRIYEAVTNFDTVANSAASMVYETVVDIVKVDGLMNYMQTDDGTNIIRKRFSMAGLLKSFNNMLLLDKKEEFQQKTNTFAGLPDLLDRYGSFLAGATDIPSTRFMGSSAQGLNATGEGDAKNYNDMIRSRQTTEYKPLLDKFDKIMAKSLGLSDDADLSYRFNSLFQMSDKEKSEIELSNAQRDTLYLDRDVIPPVTVAKELKQNNVYTNIDDEYIEELEEYDEPFTSTDPNVEEEETPTINPSEDPEKPRSQIQESVE